MQVFSEDRFLFVSISEIAKNPRAALARVEDCLGVRNFPYYRDLERRVNQGPSFALPASIESRLCEASRPDATFLASRLSSQSLEAC
jgi:hypothetical protein